VDRQHYLHRLVRGSWQREPLPAQHDKCSHRSVIVVQQAITFIHAAALFGLGFGAGHNNGIVPCGPSEATGRLMPSALRPGSRASYAEGHRGFSHSSVCAWVPQETT